VRLPIRIRLTMAYVGLLTLLLAAFSAFLLLRLRADLVTGIDRSLDGRAAQIALGFRGRGEGEFRDISDLSLQGLARGESAAQLLATDGSVLETSGDQVAGEALLTPAQLAQAGGGAHVRATLSLGTDREPFRLLAFRLGSNHPGEVVVVATSLEDVNGSIHHLFVLLLVAGPVALTGAAAGGWLLARRALTPVSRMTREAAAIGPGALGERVRVPPTQDELAQLADTLNSMLDRIERAVWDQRRLVADAAHELRTPFAIMHSELDVALRDPDLPPSAREVLASNREEVERMSRIVEDLLTLSRLDEGQLQLGPERIGLRRVAETVAADLGPLAQARGVSLSVSGDEAEVDADPGFLRRVVANLVDNAVKYSSAEAEVRIDVWRTADRAGLTVTDGGPGIHAESLPRLFDRFYRADASRTRTAGGSGLGLAIVKEIIEAHGGEVWATSVPGRGSSFWLSLPASPMTVETSRVTAPSGPALP
jgi:two-component system OmpR family sensor kinase